MHNKIWTILAVVVIVVVIGVGVVRFRGDESGVAGTVSEPVNRRVTTPAVAKTKYRNGSYTASGSYISPAQTESVQVTLEIENDVVVGATFTGNATNPASVKWQGAFKNGFTQEVVGKNIAEIALTVVNGSSLTPKGFTAALEQIKAEAQNNV